MDPRITTPQSAVTASSRRGAHFGPRNDEDGPDSPPETTIPGAAKDTAANPGIARLPPLRPPLTSFPPSSLLQYHDAAAAEAEAEAAPRHQAQQQQQQQQQQCIHHPVLETAEHQHPLVGLPPPLAYQPIQRPLTLNALPTEIHLNILRHIDTFAAIHNLRQTCRYWHALGSPESLRATIGSRPVRSLLLCTCARCHAHDADRTATLAALKSDRGYPLSGLCVTCARRAADKRLRVGRRVKMASEHMRWVCRWCGWVIAAGEEARPLAGNAPTAAGAAAPGHLQFHARCRGKYLNVLLLFFMLGWAQLAVGIAGAVMAWKHWRGVQLVFAPTVTSFVLLWVCVAAILCRNDRNPKYWFGVAVELVIMCLWIPPLYYVGRVWATEPPETRPPATVASEIIFGVNM
ncbi:uncharacterized protein E0L32_007670 [Thyridium curvatum]|uniref:F-box domain-containing protein n=1 Tax=Thyridium curvatum TaxID=1093900 RepID=A0A507B3S3_9PEZI|nr:uncharacterized protein E0L32_007670 [Thyridium curvatum]TPX11691.1 hypothetical protein E0L32_007670 [Thyridium curvatum]